MGRKWRLLGRSEIWHNLRGSIVIRLKLSLPSPTTTYSQFDANSRVYNSMMMLIDELPSLFEYHKSKKQLNLQTITIWVNAQKFIIVPNLNKYRVPTILEIDRRSKVIREYKSTQEEEYKGYRPHYFSCLIGVLELNGKKVLILAEEVNIIGSIGQRDIFKITKLIYLFYDPLEKKSLSQKEAEVLLNITAIFEQGMYFSFSYDLSLNLNSAHRQEEEKAHFNWAFNLQKQLTPFDPMWRISVIQGFVGRLQLHINGLKITIVLVSRRAVKRGGTQAFARGIDGEGNAGNYVQTEQIITIKDHYFSFVQSRGTVPVHWKEVKSTYGFSTVKFSGSLEENYSGFKSHLRFMQLRGQFKDLFLLNLLSSAKEEKKLVQNYEYLVRKLGKEESKEEVGCEVRYAYFDLHASCNSNDYSKLNSFLENYMKNAINYCNFTALRVDRLEKKLEVLNNQSGLMRVNCFNCIDRTNIAQARIAALKLIEILTYLEIEISEFKNGLAFLSGSSPFSSLYRNLWADNADALSKQYTGTGSTESLAVRKGKLSYLTTLDHGMKSIFRAVRNFTNGDLRKQQAINFIIGKRMSDSVEEEPASNVELMPMQGLGDQPQYSYKRLQEKKQTAKQ